MRFQIQQNLNLIIIFTSNAQNTLNILIFKKTLEGIIVLFRNILAVDSDPIDILIDDFPYKDVSKRLNKKYLSFWEESQEEILKTTVYRGRYYGTNVSIIRIYSNETSQFQQIFQCSLSSRRRVTNYNFNSKSFMCYSLKDGIVFPMNTSYQLGGQILRHIQCSNTNKESESRPYHNANLLGMDFFQNFDYFNLKNNMSDLQFILQLSKKLPKHWDKLSI